MDQQVAEKIKAHYLVWTGGETPDNKYEIYVYTDLNRPKGTTFDEVYYMLMDWMSDQDEGPDREKDIRDDDDEDCEDVNEDCEESQ